MSQSPPPAAAHPEADDWDFLTDQFISSTSLSSPPPNPFLSPSLEPHPSVSPVSSNPFLSPSPEPRLSPNSFLSASPPSGPQLSASFSDSPQIHTSPSGPHRSASLPFSPTRTTPSGSGSVPGTHRSASLSKSPLSSNSGYWTPPSSPPLSFSSPSKTSQFAPPAGAQHNGSLPEFSGRATQDPIFQPLVRAIVDQTRPVPLTLRPRPPRESQYGFSLRSIAFFPPSHLWAGHESDLRVWNVDKMVDQMSSKKTIRM